MGLLKQALDYYKRLKQEEKERKQLINSRSDFGLLEKLVQKCNDNPNLKIEVFLTDGTRLLLKSYEEKTKKADFINGDYEDIR